MRIGFIGCGKIGQKLMEEALKSDDVKLTFIQELAEPEMIQSRMADLGEALKQVPIVSCFQEELYEKTDLVIECATAAVLKDNLENILAYSDLMMFSATAFADEDFEQKAGELCREYERHIYLPHGAILGLDGIFDGKKAWERVSIRTTKSPASLGREDKEKTVIYDGNTRGACHAYPRNVNVHAEIAMAGLGFDETYSVIVSDPAVHTNMHIIELSGEGVSMKLEISSFSTGGVTGMYTPLSAVGSLRRVLGSPYGIQFV